MFQALHCTLPRTIPVFTTSNLLRAVVHFKFPTQNRETAVEEQAQILLLLIVTILAPVAKAFHSFAAVTKIKQGNSARAATRNEREFLETMYMRGRANRPMYDFAICNFALP